MTENRFSCARFIREIGRGTHGARALTRDETTGLYAAMLDGRVDDLELGAIMLAYRFKGETADELAGMLTAAQQSFTPLAVADRTCRAVSIPSYNGARKQPNLVPLLALLLARRRIPVLVHGVRTDPGRVTSAEIFAHLGVVAGETPAELETALSRDYVAFAPIDVLSPPMARLLAYRKRLGVRNSTHTLVKLLQPFEEPGLRLVNYTHPAYRESLAELLVKHADLAAGGALLARGTEGEAVADTRRQVQLDWLNDGQMHTLLAAEARDADAAPDELPASRDAETTAEWTREVLAGRAPTPVSIDAQITEIVRVLASTPLTAAVSG